MNILRNQPLLPTPNSVTPLFKPLFLESFSPAFFKSSMLLHIHYSITSSLSEAYFALYFTETAR